MGQVGSLSHTVALGKFVWMKSAATRSAPVPPGVCAQATRLAASGSDPRPNASSATAWQYSPSPEIGKYDFVVGDAASRFSASLTHSNSGVLPVSSW